MTDSVDYSQTVEDHQSFLVLIRPTGKLLSWKHFSRCWERICQLNCVVIPGQKRDMWIRYKRAYSTDCNDWGEFQAHRKAMGLISIGRCSNETEFMDLFESYKKEKERYSNTLYNSKLIVFGMNTDGSEILEDEQKMLIQEASSPPLTFKIDKVISTVDGTGDCTGDGMVDDTDISSCDKVEDNISEDVKNRNGQVVNVAEPVGSLRNTLHKDPDKSKKEDDLTGSRRNSTEEQTVSQITFIKRQKSEMIDKDVKSMKQSVSRTASNNSVRELPGSEVVFYPTVDMCDGLEDSIREFVTSIFFVLEGKRLDRSFERADKSHLLCAPFEKKDFVGVDPDTKSYRKKCQGRLRKHLADLCLLAGLPGEAMLHYSTSIDILKPVNDWLWMAACYEGLCASAFILAYRGCQTATVRRNQSFSVKRGVARSEKQLQGTGKKVHSYANGLHDLPDMSSKSGLNLDDMVEKYKDALMYYSKYKNAAVIEIEASLKACRILVLHRKYLQAADFLQNVVYINLDLTDDDRISRYSTLATLYAQIGFYRKASFFKRVAAMQCVAPQNPKPNWTMCHQLLVQALEGYRIYLNPSESLTRPGQMNGWPVIQIRVLHELMYSARRMGSLPLAVRYMTILLHNQLHYMNAQEKRELVTSLESFTSHNEGTTQPLALESGIIVPHVPLLNLPLIKSFTLMPLQDHLQPRTLHCEEDPLDNVFIFTPLHLGATDTDAIKTDMDFSWVDGDISEIHMRVSNPLPDELRISQLTVIAEGVEVEAFSTSHIIPAEAASYVVKVMIRPTSTGDLKILGYSTKVFGVKSNCRLRDCFALVQSFFTVKVTPALPQISLTSALPKSASFLSFGEEFNMVTSATAVLYTGQRSECTVTLQNTGRLPVELVNVSLESTRNKECASEVFRWNPENIESQLPLQVSSLLCFNVALHAVDECLLKGSLKASSDDSMNKCTEGKVVEAILKVEYSGGPGMAEDYCRCCSIAFSIDVFPSVVFHKWDVILSESSDHCYLLFDLQNVCGHEIELYHSSQCVYLKHEQTKRICVEVERSDPRLFEGDTSSSRLFSQFLATLVDIRWTIPSLEVSGLVNIDRLLWTPEQQQLVYISPISWDVRINSQLISPLHIGCLEYKIGQLVRVKVDVNIKSDSEIDGDEGVLSIYCCQHCDNGGNNIGTEKYVSTIGSQSLVIPKISVANTISHSCMYMFTCTGFYKFEIKMQVKGQVKEGEGQVPTEVKGQQLTGFHTYKCSTVIEVNIMD